MCSVQATLGAFFESQKMKQILNSLMIKKRPLFLSVVIQLDVWSEKQWYRPNRLPGIAYPFKLKGGVSRTYANENVGQP